LEFEPLDFRSRSSYVGFDFSRGCVVGFLGGQIDEFPGVAQAPLEPVQADDHLFQPGAFLAEILGAIGLVPNAGLFEFAGYFL
jgi:hypothetical protein